MKIYVCTVQTRGTVLFHQNVNTVRKHWSFVCNLAAHPRYHYPANPTGLLCVFFKLNFFFVFFFPPQGGVSHKPQRRSF